MTEVIRTDAYPKGIPANSVDDVISCLDAELENPFSVLLEPVEIPLEDSVIS